MEAVDRALERSERGRVGIADPYSGAVPSPARGERDGGEGQEAEKKGENM